MTFTNQQLSPADLPQMETVHFQALHPNYRKVQFFRAGLFALFLIIVVVIAAMWAPIDPIWKFLSAGVFGLWIAFNFFVIHKRFRYKGYALREHDLMYRSGWLYRSVTVIPFNRVQHTEIGQGPIDRYFQLVKLTLYTAGGELADLTIAGLTPEEAQRIRDFVVRKAAQPDGND